MQTDCLEANIYYTHNLHHHLATQHLSNIHVHFTIFPKRGDHFHKDINRLVLGAFAELLKAIINIVKSVCPSVLRPSDRPLRNNLASTKRISIKCYI